jgi:hypothetical protein
MSSQPIQSAVLNRIRLTVSDALLADLEKQAKSRKTTVERLITERFKAFVSYDDQKPLYFTDAERQRLESLIGKNVSTADEALTMLTRALSVRTDGVEFVLNPRLLARLKSRCFQSDFGKWLSQLIVEELERFVGMR